MSAQMSEDRLRIEANLLVAPLVAEVRTLTRERDEARAEVVRVKCAHSDIADLLAKSEAKAAALLAVARAAEVGLAAARKGLVCDTMSATAIYAREAVGRAEAALDALPADLREEVRRG